MARTRSGCRRFTISDGMILVAATAVGLAWSGNIFSALRNGFLPLDGTPARLWQRIAEVMGLILPCLVLWTITLPILGARKPRPAWRKVSRQPGMAACLALSLNLAIGGLLALGLIGFLYHRGSLPTEFWKNVAGSLIELLILAPPFAGLGVITTWGMLLLQGRWRGNPGWIDRTGRALGLFWIMAMVILDAFWVKNSF